MRVLLIVFGVLAIIGGVSPLCFESMRSTGAFIMPLVSGLVSAVVFFVLSTILSDLETLIDMVHSLKNDAKQ